MKKEEENRSGPVGSDTAAASVDADVEVGCERPLGSFVVLHDGGAVLDARSDAD